MWQWLVEGWIMYCVRFGCMLVVLLGVVDARLDANDEPPVEAVTIGPLPRDFASLASDAIPLREYRIERHTFFLFPVYFSTRPRIELTLPEVGPVTLAFTPVSVRASGYSLMIQRPDGTFESVDPGPENTYTGDVVDFPGSTVAASVTETELMAMIRLESGATYWVEPLRSVVAEKEFGSIDYPWPHIIYRGGDTLCTGVCSQPDVDPPSGNQGDNPTPHGGCGTDELPCIAELAIDVDFEYFQARGASNFAVQDRISAIINVVNHQFQRDVHLTHRLQAIVIRSAEPDPYTAAGATDLLNQVKAEWVANGGTIPRDLVQLFTGRDLTGSETGAAFDAAVCNDEFHYSVVQSDFSPLFACVTDNSAHFLGHLWGATHCDCPASTMNATLTCANTFSGAGSTSIAEINNFLESATCLSSEGFAPPNDRCDQATLVTTSGTYVETNVGASNDGGTFACGTPGAGVRDVYWTFTPAASGPIGVSTCGTTFDTILSVHTGCPATPTNVVNCNDDCFFGVGAPCPFTIQSCFTFNGIAGQTYYARVSGFTAANIGQITFNITMPDGPVCTGDLDCDDDRDASDIPHFVQALIDPAGYTGSHTCDIFRANLNGDGVINGGDIASFTALLTSSPCP